METFCSTCGVTLDWQNQYNESHYTGTHYANVCTKCIDNFVSNHFLQHNEYPSCTDADCKWDFGNHCPNGNTHCGCRNFEMALKFPITSCYGCGGILEKKLYCEEHAGHTHTYGICLECIEIDLPCYLACREGSVICSHSAQYGGKMYPCNLLVGISTSEKIQKTTNEILYKWDRDNKRQNQLLESLRSWKERIHNKGPWKDISQFKTAMTNPKLRPCPMCGIFIRHRDGCWRMDCPICSHSFWFPTGEAWSSFSEEKQKEYGEQNREWWLEAGNLVYYWLDWFPGDLREELEKQLL